MKRLKVRRNSQSDIVNMVRQVYPSDVSVSEWKIIEPLLPKSKLRGRKRDTNLREVVNATFTY